MDADTRHFIEHDLLTLAELAPLLGISLFAARKRAERACWPYVMKSGTRLYMRADIPLPDSTNNAG